MISDHEPLEYRPCPQSTNRVPQYPNTIREQLYIYAKFLNIVWNFGLGGRKIVVDNRVFAVFQRGQLLGRAQSAALM